MDSDHDKLIRIETKMEHLTESVDEIKQLLKSHATACPECKADLVSKINKVESESKEGLAVINKKITVIVAIVAGAGGTIGATISKIIGWF